MSRTCLLLLGMLCARSLAAQGTVVVPEAPLDSARITLRNDLLRFRDTLSSIDAAAARLQRDFRQASAASLISRARVMREACARSVRNVAPARKAVLAAEASDARRVRSRTEMVQALDQLREALARCQSEFESMSKPDQGEKVRGYGNARAIPVLAAIRKYERTLATFLHAMGIKVLPLGAGDPVIAG